MTHPAPSPTPHSAAIAPAVPVAMVGMGTVGGGVYKLLASRDDVRFCSIAVRDTAKARGVEGLDPSLLCSDPVAAASHPEAQLVIEVMGGIDLAKTVVETALKNGKHVVTANKALIATHGEALFALAEKHHVRLMLEGAVAAGIPIIMPLQLALAANRIHTIAGIINGTTNYILSQMTHQGQSYEDALKDAQQKGFAEADPTSDVDGHDSAYKLAILGSIASKQFVPVPSVHCEGIRNITAQDIALAKSLGYRIKLIGLYKLLDDGRCDLRVHPMLVPASHPLASIENEYNAIWVDGHAVGDVMFYGKGAGELPTASAVCGDALAIIHGLQTGTDPMPAMALSYNGQATLQPIGETQNRYYIRLNTTDSPGVIGTIGTACGTYGVSIESIVQQGINPDGTASIVIITHTQTESQVQQALDTMKAHPTIQNVACVMRIL